MYDLTVTPGMTDAKVRAAETASDRGFTEDAPLRVLVEGGTHDLLTNAIPLTRPYRVIQAVGAEFRGTGDPKHNRALMMLSDATVVTCEGGSVVGADVRPFTQNPGRCEQSLVGMTFADYDAAVDGIGTPGSEGDTLRSSSRKGAPTKEAPWITRLENCSFIDWAGASTTHPIYLEGRYGELHVVGCTFAGGRDSSALKTTRNVLTVRRSQFFGESKQLRGESPDGSRSFSKFIDLASCSDAAIENNIFYGALQGKAGGVSEMIFSRARRSLWASDDPPPADVHYERHINPPERWADVLVDASNMNLEFDSEGVFYATLDDARLSTPPVCSGKDNWLVKITPEEAIEGSYRVGVWREGTVKRRAHLRPRITIYRDAQHLFVSSFIDATKVKLGRYAKDDWWDTAPKFRKVIRSNRFVREHNPRFSPLMRGKLYAYRDDGTYPGTAVRQFSTNNCVHPIPQGWCDRSIADLENNTFVGWRKNEDYTRIWSQGLTRPDDIKHGIGDCYYPESPPLAVINESGSTVILAGAG
jgi:hypothetical protein